MNFPLQITAEGRGILLHRVLQELDRNNLVAVDLKDAADLLAVAIEEAHISMHQGKDITNAVTNIDGDKFMVSRAIEKSGLENTTPS